MQGARATRQNAARALEYTRLTLRQTQGIAVGAVQAEARQLLLHQMHLYRRATAPVCRPTVDTRVSSAETGHTGCSAARLSFARLAPAIGETRKLWGCQSVGFDPSAE